MLPLGQASGYLSLSSQMVKNPIYGLQLWLDADKLTGLSDGDAVSSWTDSSGNGNHAVQATAAKKPIYKTNVVGGHPAIRFDGTKFLSSGELSSLYQSGITVFAAVKASVSADYTVVSQFGGGTVGSFYLGQSSSQMIGVIINAAVTKVQISSANDFSTDWRTLTLRYTGAQVETYQDGVMHGIPLALTGIIQDSNRPLMVGSYHIGTALLFNGDIAEILIYNRSLSDAEMTRVNNYLYGKYITPVPLGISTGFSFLPIGDIQLYTKDQPWIETVQNNFLINRWADLRAAVGWMSGDLVDTVGSATEWATVKSKVDVIDAANLPVVCGMGNHDFDPEGIRGSDLYNANFGQSRYTGLSWWNGGFYEAGHAENSYYLFTVGAVDYILLNLEFGPRQVIVDWANVLLTTYATRKAIVCTHCYMYIDNTRVGAGDLYNPHLTWEDSNDGDELWDELIKLHSNIILVTSGHELTTTGGARLSSVGDGGNIVWQFLSNYQVLVNGGLGYIRIFNIIPGTPNQIISTVYSPVLKKFLTDSDNQFTVTY